MVFIVVTFPVETIKPFVFLNVSNATFLITQSLCAVISEKLKDYTGDSENVLCFMKRKSEILRILYLLGFLVNYLQSFLMSSLALAVMFLGKSMASMPFRMIL